MNKALLSRLLFVAALLFNAVPRQFDCEHDKFWNIWFYRGLAISDVLWLVAAHVNPKDKITNLFYHCTLFLVIGNVLDEFSPTPEQPNTTEYLSFFCIVVYLLFRMAKERHRQY